MNESAYARRVFQLSEKSVEKGFDAFADIDWDAPENRIELDDPRFERPESDPLGGTEWYRALPAPVRAKLGLHLLVHQLKVGVAFESILSRGLLELATSISEHDPAMRYAFHEVIEEAQHSLMFSELIRRTNLRAIGLTGWEGATARFVPRLGRVFPELFFIFVLGGEAPVDHAQKAELERGSDLHPLIQTIMKIHVLEEARHLCFAKEYLKSKVPHLSDAKRFHIEVRAPFILGIMAKQMLVAPPWLCAEYAIPRDVIKEAYGGSKHRDRIYQGVRPVLELMDELGLIRSRSLALWRIFDIDPMRTRRQKLLEAV